MIHFPCPYLGGEVELTDERERHIAHRHPDLVPAHRDRLAQTLADPDEIRRDADYPDTRLFCRWFDEVLGGKMIVVVVVSAGPPDTRYWMVTAFAARKAAKGDLEWKRP